MNAAPRLSTRLILEELGSAPDGAGGTADVWTEVGVHYAALEAQSSSEGQAGQRRFGSVRCKATLRYAPYGSVQRPRPDQRFRDGNRIFDIIGVAEADDRKRWLICWLEEGAQT